MEMNFASKGVAGTALGIAIGSGVLSLANGNCNGGLLGGILGGGGCNATRYDLEQQKAIADRDMEISYLKGRDAAKTDSLALYQYVDGRFRTVEAQIAQQAVTNAQIAANISCMQTSIAALNGLTKTVIPIDNVCPLPATATTT